MFVMDTNHCALMFNLITHGFRDDKFDRIFGGREKLNGYMEEVDRQECMELFEEFNAKHKVNY